MQTFGAFVCGIYEKVVKDVEPVAPGHTIRAAYVACVVLAITLDPEFHSSSPLNHALRSFIAFFFLFIAFIMCADGMSSIPIGILLININLFLAIKYDEIPSLLVRAEGGGVDNEAVWQLLPKSHPQEDPG